jgi:signal transduction histidine kinase
VRLEVRSAAHLPPVRADAGQVRLMIEQLADNALHAMPNGGVITLASATARAVHRNAAAPPRDYVQLEMLDTGTGIAPEIRAHILEPGFTTREGADGVGLPLVRWIAEEHGGFVTVESEPGTGSAITIHLPADPDTRSTDTAAGDVADHDSGALR